MTRQEKLFELMRSDLNRCEAAYRSWSGTDVAEAEFYRLRRLFWNGLHDGLTREQAFERLDSAWRQYAAENNAKVASAPKLKRGPRSGQSSIQHRWVSPEKANDCLPFLCEMTRQINALPAQD